MAGSDFIEVQLTAQGALQAGAHPMRVSGRTSIEFTAGKPTRVAKYEWDMMLKNFETSHGLPLFELVPDAVAPAAVATPAPAAAPAPAKPAFELPAIPDKPQEAK